MNFDEYSLAYDQELRQGLRLAGQSPEWFAEQRVAIVRQYLDRQGTSPSQVLEFGCGTGNHVPFFRRAFRNSHIIGIDISRQSLECAIGNYGGSDVRFCTPEEFRQTDAVDLVYVNGVFHHIPANEHADWLRYLYEILKPDGTLTIFDNNPFSLPARIVMKHVPFDRDAVMVNPYRFAGLLSDSGFTMTRRSFHFIFPRMLSFLRPLEAPLSSLPLGAQYCLFAKKPA